MKDIHSVPNLTVPNVSVTRSPPEPLKIENHVWVISGVVILGMIMSILDTTIVNVALDTLSKDLHSPISEVQWVVTGYLLALAAVMPGDRLDGASLGAKRVYLVSLALFTLGSVACGLSNTLVALVVFRVLQGIGGGMIMPPAQLIMAQVAGPQRMGRVMGIVSMPAMLAPIFGPVIGGLVLQNLHWSWIFFVNAPIGASRSTLAGACCPTPTRARLVARQARPGAAPGRRRADDLWHLRTRLGRTPGLDGSDRAAASPGSFWGWRSWHALRIERPLLDVGSTPTKSSRGPRLRPSASAPRCSAR